MMKLVHLYSCKEETEGNSGPTMKVCTMTAVVGVFWKCADLPALNVSQSIRNQESAVNLQSIAYCSNEGLQ